MIKSCAKNVFEDSITERIHLPLKFPFELSDSMGAFMFAMKLLKCANPNINSHYLLQSNSPIKEIVVA